MYLGVVISVVLYEYYNNFFQYNYCSKPFNFSIIDKDAMHIKHVHVHQEYPSNERTSPRNITNLLPGNGDTNNDNIKISKASQHVPSQMKYKNKFPLRTLKRRSAAHCKYCLERHNESKEDAYLGTPHMKSILRNKRENKQILSPTLTVHRRQQVLQRNLTFPLEARKQTNGFHQSPYTVDTIIYPYAGNYLMNGVASGSIVNTDTYEDLLVREYNLLTEKGMINNEMERPNLSSLRIDGIRKEPLPPIRSNVDNNDHSPFEKIPSKDEKHPGLLSNVNLDVKKIKPGFR